MWNELSDAIVAKVKDCSKFNDENVFDYAVSNVSAYPYATVTIDGNQGSYFADTQRVGRDYNFAVDIYQERVEQGSDNSERIVRSILDELIAIFDADVYLNTVLQGRGFCRPFNGAAAYTGEQLNTRSVRLIIACQVIQ